MKKCYELLNLTSRSFAMVIQHLDDELRPAICLFYLVLRGLDTIEDDMTIPNEKKIPLLHKFDGFLKTPGWTFTESGPNEKDAPLLVQFDVVIHEYLKLKPVFQETIADITRRMAFGMTEFMTRKVETLKDWDLYCHYVAGLVGIGLSRIFSASGLESPDVAAREDLSNSMGLFLQKTNIIRDYLEDIEQGRVFWPKEVWSLYVPDKNKDLAEFKKLSNSANALDCLNHLINNALGHVPDVIAYMSQIKNQSVFNFCAIPQVMAIATLSACYNNHGVFTGVVKIRKGEAVKLIIQSRSLTNLAEVFDDHLRKIQRRIFNQGNPINAATAAIVQKSLQRDIAPLYTPSPARGLFSSPAFLGLLCLVSYFAFQNKHLLALQG